METTTVAPLRLAAPMTHPPFRTAAVLGAGTMGAQIAAHLANAGLQVHLLDVTPEAIGREGPPNSIVERAFKAAQKAKPDPFVTEQAQERITLGNFDADFERVGEVDWVIEVVVERMAIKRDVMERIEAAARPDAVISTNTSGLPIGEIAHGRSADFRRRFLGTHFFNPPRYLKLLELIPTPDTDPDVLERVAQFGRIHLGKGIVVAKDRPYFIGNRIGVYGLMRALEQFSSGAYTIEEIDALTGPLVGRPKSATFRTADLVGLDVMADVARNLHEKLTDDESRDAFGIPDVLAKLVESGSLGEKTKAGFYKKEGKQIKSLDPSTMEYIGETEKNLGDLGAIKKAGALPDRLRALYADDGRAGQFFRTTALDLFGYAARRLPEISDRTADVDRAIRWGFGWELGPFEMWDALGFERVKEDMQEAGIDLPDWIDEVGSDGFYRRNGTRQAFAPGDGYQEDPVPSDRIELAALRTDDRTLWENDEAALLDLGEGVALYEFRSKANSLGRAVIEGLMEVIEKVENDRDLRGLVIGNEGSNFSVGANLGEVAMLAAQGQFDLLEQMVAGFQQAIQRVRYAAKPVVVCTHQRVLGGGCEMAMACPYPVAATETYIGLVELGVGLIPAGTGTMRLAALAAAQAPTDFPSHIQPYLQKYYENVAMASVATSAQQGVEMGYLPASTRVVMHEDRRFHVARQRVIDLSESGYLPPPVTTHIRVLGRPTRAAFEVALHQYREGDYISAYDQHLAEQLALVITGGDLSAPQDVHEDYLIDLEREVFMRLLGETNTQERITHMLMKGKPLRN